jgi:hypothetical protein
MKHQPIYQVVWLGRYITCIPLQPPNNYEALDNLQIEISLEQCSAITTALDLPNPITIEYRMTVTEPALQHILNLLIAEAQNQISSQKGYLEALTNILLIHLVRIQCNA